MNFFNDAETFDEYASIPIVYGVVFIGLLYEMIEAN